jgi:hypothetical protein
MEAASLRRSTLIRINCSAGLRSRVTVAKKSELRAQVRSNFALKPGRRERNFSMQRRRAQVRLFVLQRLNAETRTNSKKAAVRGTNARITRGVRYLKTGWWCGQSDTNRSPC